MDVESLTNIEECNILLDPKKVKINNTTKLSLEKTCSEFLAQLGLNTICSSQNQNEAREFYEKVKSALKKGNYRITLTPGYRPKCDFF